MGYKITIDGPSAAGKGYVAQELSRRLNFLNVDTGAIYRAFAVLCRDNNINIENENDIKQALNSFNINLTNEENILKIYLNNEEISQKIRTEQVAMLAAQVSKIPIVREHIKNIQQELASKNNIVMEGRDIGSVVFPEADLKIYLTADVAVRAKRRYKDLLVRGKNVTYEEVLNDIKNRDKADMTRQISPLVKTPDMIEVDTTDMNKKQVIQKILELVNKKDW